MQTDNGEYSELREKIKLLLTAFDETNICLFCKFPYKMKTSIGQMECWRHPGTYDSIHGYYPCCNKKSDRSKGCVKCDHNFTGRFTKLYMLVPVWFYEHHKLRKVPKDHVLAVIRDYNVDGTLSTLKTKFKIKVSD